MRILGIDPGLQRTGFGVVEKTSGSTSLHYIASGVISTPAATPSNLSERLKTLFEGISTVVQRYQPEIAVVEIVFVNVNPKSTLLLGQARGACLTALAVNGLAVQEYTALQMKQAITGHGKAAKAQVQEMVVRLLRLGGMPGADAADALGLAITHAHQSNTWTAAKRAG